MNMRLQASRHAQASDENKKKTGKEVATLTRKAPRLTRGSGTDEETRCWRTPAVSMKPRTASVRTHNKTRSTSKRNERTMNTNKDTHKADTSLQPQRIAASANKPSTLSYKLLNYLCVIAARGRDCAVIVHIVFVAIQTVAKMMATVTKQRRPPQPTKQRRRRRRRHCNNDTATTTLQQRHCNNNADDDNDGGHFNNDDRGRAHNTGSSSPAVLLSLSLSLSLPFKTDSRLQRVITR